MSDFLGKRVLKWGCLFMFMAAQGDRLLATWSLGAKDEDAPGQNMVLATSDDGGRTWSAPTVVAAGQPEKIVAFYDHYEYVPGALCEPAPGVSSCRAICRSPGPTIPWD